MPVTSVDENTGMMFREDQIRFTWNAIDMKPVAEAIPMKELSDRQFRLRILSTNTSHHFRPFPGRYDVGHISSWKSIGNRI